MRHCLLILALLLTGGAPVEAIQPGAYRSVTRTKYGNRFTVSGWQVYTLRGWRHTWLEDHARKRRHVWTATRYWDIDTSAYYPQPCLSGVDL